MDLFDKYSDVAESPVVERKQPEIRNAAGKRAAMLARLKAGPLSTFDAERLVHRGQATIHQLNCEGHRIELDTLDGVSHYVYRDFTARVKLPPTAHAKYIQSTHWRTTAAARKKLDGYRCQQCGASESLETHHWRYHLFAENVEHDLITFCRTCHGNVHEAIKGSGVHFPRFVSEEIANRIEAGE